MLQSTTLILSYVVASLTEKVSHTETTLIATSHHASEIHVRQARIVELVN